METFETHLRPGSEVGVVTFGSRTNAGRPAPSYAFMNVLLGVREAVGAPFDVFYFVAHRNDWYLGGVRGLGDSLAESAEALGGLIGGYRRTIFVGNSMGGYAALALGWRAPCTRVLAFSPQTRFEAAFCDAIGEDRWMEDRAGMQAAHPVENFAVRRLARDGTPPERGAAVYAGLESAVDMAYASDLDGLAGVEVSPVAGSGHDLVHDLRADGRLARIVAGEIEGLAGG